MLTIIIKPSSIFTPCPTIFCSHLFCSALFYQVDAARKVAERALRTIGFREEGEKFNVWTALLNLEHKFGDADSLEQVFSQAVRESRGKTLHLSLADMFEASGNLTGAEEVPRVALGLKLVVLHRI